MNRIWKELALTALITLLVPWVMVCAVNFFRSDLPQKQLQQSQPTQPTGSTEAAKTPMTVDVLVKGTRHRMDMDEYLTGVLLAEMPGSFHSEAKKAQVVVARTYALRTVQLNRKHPGAVCGDSGCCQGYLSPDAYLAAGGDPQILEKARQAVGDTAGLVLTYGGSLIEATYFSCSGGRTEDAVAVWGTDVPYLQSVDSPGEENASVYTDSVIFSPTEFQNTLGLSLAGKPESWFGTVTYTEGGGVATMVIGGKQFSGTQLRQKLKLRSTAFTMEVTAQGISVTTRGYGHRVGMSQYGADAMARNGSSFQKILSHYYPGTELSVFGIHQ